MACSFITLQVTALHTRDANFSEMSSFDTYVVSCRFSYVLHS